MNKIKSKAFRTSQTFKTFKSDLLIFSVLDDRLLMLHGDFISAQWPLDQIGIRLDKLAKKVKLSFMSIKDERYQAFYLDISEYTKLFDYFRLLGFLKDDILCQAHIQDNSNDENKIRQKSDD